MITFFYEASRTQKSKNKPYWKLAYKVNKVLVNMLFPLRQRWEKACGTDSESRIIVSLTTYPARVQGVWVTIASLLNQTMKPYKVILWLAEEQFPKHEIIMNPLSLSVSCHIGPGALAIACSHRIGTPV